MVALAVFALLASAHPANAAVAVSGRYQLRGHLPELGSTPTMRVFTTQAAYDSYRTSLGDANVFPPSSSLFMSFDKDVLALYTRGNDVGNRCIATTMFFGASGDRLRGNFDWQSGTCGAPSGAHYPFILAAISRTAADGSSWLQATRSVCAFVGTPDTEACAAVGTGSSTGPTIAPTTAPTTAPSATAVPSVARTTAPIVAATATSAPVAVSSVAPSASRAVVAAAGATAPPESSPNAVDFWLGAALVGFGVMIGIVLMNARRRQPTGFRRS